jgi:dolichol-phosphate mannosyltransferase
MVASILLLAQIVALLVLLARLSSGRTRRPPIEPCGDDTRAGAVSVLVATLDEAKRIGPCLDGLARQGATMLEAIVIDSHSRDGTGGLVEAATGRDARIRLVNDPPLPDGWVGKVWALEHGLTLARGEWVLGVDADTDPVPGMVCGALRAALDAGLDVVSFSPRFADQSAAEQWLQPAMLVTLVYRFGAAGVATRPERVMANGQCFLARRDVLVAHGGYSSARVSFADDVTLARHLAARGARVGFLDGSRLYAVRSYASVGEMWREWGRSIDLSDATTRVRQWADIAFLVLAQGMPAAMLVALLATGSTARALLWVNAALLAIRVLMLLALRTSYDRVRWTFWLSPLADPLAVLRVILSTLTRRRTWRGRAYGAAMRGGPTERLTADG